MNFQSIKNSQGVIKQLYEIGIILLVSFLGLAVWHIIPTTLNDEFFNTDYKLLSPFLRGEYSIVVLSFLEVVKYLILSCLLTISIFISFWSKKTFEPKLSYPLAFSIFTVVIFITCYFLDQNAKATYMVNWLGNDYPYGLRFAYFFMLYPIAMWLVVFFTLRKIRILNIPLLFFVGFGATYIPYMPYGFDILSESKLRSVISGGYFVFFITLFLGLCFLIINFYLDKGDEQGGL